MKLARKITSLLLIFSFIFVTFSSIGLEVSPHGKDAFEAGWTFLGVNMGGIKHLHSVFGYLLLGLVILHMALNIKPIISYLKKSNTNNLPSLQAVWVTVLCSVLFVVIILSGGNDAEKIKKYREMNTTELTYYQNTLNDNRPSDK